MFLLFASTSDVEQIGLQLSLESVQSKVCRVASAVCKRFYKKTSRHCDGAHVSYHWTHLLNHWPARVAMTWTPVGGR